MPYRRIYEINTRVWLAELVAAQTIPAATLAAIPELYIDLWRRWQIDAVWLMGVWEPSLYSARVVRENTASVVSLQPALDDFTLDDCVSSPYAVRNYTVSEQLGGLEGLLRLRDRLHQAGMGLILDFVPNHTACDHPWVHDYPQYYVQGSLAEATRAPGDYFPVQTAQGLHYIAHGKDPYFPSWCDTAQLNYSNLELHDAMQDQLLRLAQWCDGVRCDMAMLCLSDIFSRTWSRLDLPVPPREFWHEALQAVQTRFPHFCCMAEVYWGLQTRLQQLGFQFTYDKEFYDALLARDIDRLGASICTPHSPLEANVRFLENHDETRAAACFSDNQQEAAMLAITTLPGAILLHEGQTEGYRVHTPVQLCRRRQEPSNQRLRSFYERFLSLPDIRQGHFVVLHPCSAREGDDTYKALLAWAWAHETQCWLVVINYAERMSQGLLNLVDLPLPSGVVRFRDHLHDSTYAYSRETVQGTGLPVVLPPFGTHLLEVIPRI
jgi:Alpha amylase, catalytic domain